MLNVRMFPSQPMKFEILPWLILFLPLLAAAGITLFTLRYRTVSALLSIGAIVTGFVLSARFHQRQRLAAGARRIHRQLAVHRQPARGFRPEARCAEPDDAAHRHRRRRRDPHLFRSATCTTDRGFSRFFACPEPVHVLDARHRAGEQFPRDVHLLGTGRRLQLPAHRFLV